MYVSPEDIAYAMGYLECFFSTESHRDLLYCDEWFSRSNPNDYNSGIDFNLHNRDGEWQIDAYEMVNGEIDKGIFVCLWKESD